MRIMYFSTGNFKYVRELVEHCVRNRGDELAIVVGMTTCAKTNVVESHYGQNRLLVKVLARTKGRVY